MADINSETPEMPEIPEEFQKIMTDFINDITTTFPEYQPLINKWWKMDAESGSASKDSVEYIFKYCLTVYPERFFDILYKNGDIFAEGSMTNTEFLPGISFKYLWTCDISDNTKTTIWKYLQLIILAIVGCVNNKDAFGDASKMFETLNEDDLRGKLQETMEEMQKLFQSDSNAESDSGSDKQNKTGSGGINMENMPSADDIHSHIHGMLNSKLGSLAKEIAEETAGDLDIDMENIKNPQDVFQSIFKNPGKLMGLVKNVGEKLDNRIKSGEISQSELLAEAGDIMNKMKSMPGMGNIQEMFSKMGMQVPPNMAGLGKNTKLDVNAMQNKLNQQMKTAQMFERMQKKKEMRQQAAAVPPPEYKPPAYTDEQLIALFSDMEKPDKTPRAAPSDNADKDKKKKKKKKA